MRVVRYELRSAAELDTLARAPLPLGIHAAQPRAASHRDLYLDTPDDALRERGVVCRLRIGTRLPHRLTLVLGSEGQSERVEATVREATRRARARGRHGRAPAPAEHGRSVGAGAARRARGRPAHARREPRPAPPSARRDALRPHHGPPRRRVAHALPALRAPSARVDLGVRAAGRGARTRARPRRRRGRSPRARRAGAALDAAGPRERHARELRPRIAVRHHRGRDAGDAQPRAEPPRLPAPRARHRRGSLDAAPGAAAIPRHRDEQSGRDLHGADARAASGRRVATQWRVLAWSRRADRGRPARSCGAGDRLDRRGAIALRGRVSQSGRGARRAHPALERSGARATGRPSRPLPRRDLPRAHAARDDAEPGTSAAPPAPPRAFAGRRVPPRRGERSASGRARAAARHPATAARARSSAHGDSGRGGAPRQRGSPLPECARRRSPSLSRHARRRSGPRRAQRGRSSHRRVRRDRAPTLQRRRPRRGGAGDAASRRRAGAREPASRGSRVVPTARSSAGSRS